MKTFEKYFIKKREKYFHFVNKSALSYIKLFKQLKINQS